MARRRVRWWSLVIGIVGLCVATATVALNRRPGWRNVDGRTGGSRYVSADVPYQHAGSAHCAWQNRTFIAYARGQYERRLGASQRPAAAKPTGWKRRDGMELWVASRGSSEPPRAIFLVRGRTVQTWLLFTRACM